MNPIARLIARFTVGLVLALMFISGLAQLAGCHITRQWPSAKAPATATTTPQPIDCGTWVDCA